MGREKRVVKSSMIFTGMGGGQTQLGDQKHET